MAAAQQTQRDHAPKLRSLELGRFIAALAVMLGHVVPSLNQHAASHARLLFGGFGFPAPLGVQYFFVLSGFLMASIHHRDFGKCGAAARFWWRRACRIYPAYWLALCIPVFYLYGAMTPGLTLHLILLDPWSTQDYIPPAWTLRLEVAFYITFGLCLLPYIGRPLLVLWVGLTFWHCCWMLTLPLHPRWTTPFYNFIQNDLNLFFSFMEFYFFAGLGAGFVYARLRPGRRVSIGLMAFSFALLMVALPVEDWGRSYSAMPLFMAGMGIVLAGNLLGLALLERHGVLRLGNYALMAGAVSYPLYLFHAPVLLVISNSMKMGLYGTPGLYACLAAVATAILAVAFLVTYLFDRPVQRLLRRVGRKKEQGAAPPLPYSASRRW